MPDIRIITAVIFPASFGTVLINAAEEAFPVKVGTEPVLFPRNKIWPLLIPFDNALFYLFFGQCKYKAAADRLAGLFSLASTGRGGFLISLFVSVDEDTVAVHEFFDELPKMSLLFLRDLNIFVFF